MIHLGSGVVSKAGQMNRPVVWLVSLSALQKA